MTTALTTPRTTPMTPPMPTPTSPAPVLGTTRPAAASFVDVR